MKEFIAVLASLLPPPAIVDMIDESVKEYKGNPTDENLSRVRAACALLISNEVSNQMGGPEKMLKQMEESARIHERMNSGNS